MQLFLHVGYPKTATTWWQNKIFADHPHIGLIGTSEKYSDWGKHLVTIHDFEFDAEFVRESALKVASKLQTDRVVISWEHLLGDSAFGGDKLVCHMNRLHQCFPEAKIVIFIREQFNMIKSLYKQYVQEGGTWSFGDFLQADYPYRIFFSRAYLNYFQTIQHYETLFGKDNIYIGLFEQVKHSPQKVIQDIFKWMDIPVENQSEVVTDNQANKSLSEVSIRLLRVINYFLPGRFNGRGPVPYTKTPFLKAATRVGFQNYLDPYLIAPLTSGFSSLYFPSRIEQSLRTYYAEVNHNLVQKYELPLGEFNYILP